MYHYIFHSTHTTLYPVYTDKHKKGDYSRQDLSADRSANSLFGVFNIFADYLTTVQFDRSGDPSFVRCCLVLKCKHKIVSLWKIHKESKYLKWTEVKYEWPQKFNLQKKKIHPPPNTVARNLTAENILLNGK